MSATSPSVSLLLLVALAHERAAVMRAARGWRPRPGSPFPTWMRAGPPNIALVQMGIGTARAGAAVAWAIPALSPASLVNLGFAGGLAPHLEAGALVAGTDVCTDAAPEVRVVPALTIPWKCAGMHQGRIVTASTLATTGAEKQALFERTGALAVDMEADAVVRTALAHSLEPSVVKVILDDVRTPIDRRLVSVLTAAGGLDWKQIASLALGAPGALASAVRMLGQTRRASRALTRVAESLIA